MSPTATPQPNAVLPAAHGRVYNSDPPLIPSSEGTSVAALRTSRVRRVDNSLCFPTATPQPNAFFPAARGRVYNSYPPLIPSSEGT